MKNAQAWRATKFEQRGGRWRGARDPLELGVGSRLISDLVVSHYEERIPAHARGRLLDLGCGKVPLYGCYAAFVEEVTCVDWADGEHIDRICDLNEPLPFASDRFDTVILSDVLEHLPDPAAAWREIARVLAPGGKILMNVPFYYSVHAHPHDYYRYTNFALERFVRLSGLALIELNAVGGLLEVLVDLMAKAACKLPWVGPPVAAALQSAAFGFARTPLGKRVRRVSSRHFPLGYFMVAQRPGEARAQ